VRECALRDFLRGRTLGVLFLSFSFSPLFFQNSHFEFCQYNFIKQFHRPALACTCLYLLVLVVLVSYCTVGFVAHEVIVVHEHIKSSRSYKNFSRSKNMDTRVTPRSSIENNAASEGGDATANVPRRRAFWFPNTSLPRELDIFGFYLSIKHSLVALLLSIIMCGPFGSKSTLHTNQ
jgi:hypothetical protein